MNIEEFGAHLLTTGDLDPVYIALNNSNLDSTMRNKWLLAYCAFYNCGFACWASEKEPFEFWYSLMKAAKNQLPTPFGARWPRASERRHFRGDQAIQAIRDWESRSVYARYPEAIFSDIANNAPSFIAVANKAKELRSVGNWLSFKIVDLVDACMQSPIDQSDIMSFMYDAPKQSLLRLWRENLKLPDSAKPRNERQTILEMVDYYKNIFKDFEVPHKPDQKIDMFCLETIFCKHQSHINGHYPLYKDIKEITHGLEDWLPYSECARLFKSKMPRYA